MRRHRLIGGAALLGILAGVGVFWDPGARPDPAVSRGRQVYAANCAACHGAQLEGQPDWQSPAANGRLPAPPHDKTGHSWHHSDALLLSIIALGTAAVVGNGYESDMPGFAGALTPEDMEAVLAFIKSTWPEREAKYQRRVSGVE